MSNSELIDKYLAWNSYIADFFFNESSSGTPVYLDVDDEFFSEIEKSNFAYQFDLEPFDEFIYVIRSLIKEGNSDQFLKFEILLRKYNLKVKGGDVEVGEPPIIALLAVFVMAASQMSHNEEHGANAYYPILAKILEIPNSGPFQNRFRENTEPFWAALDQWLTNQSGKIGVPSANAISHRYVGLPISQSLIRTSDRKNLPRFFRWAGLMPGSELAPISITPLLQEWIKSVPSATTPIFQRIFNRAGSQEPISQIVATELESWNGAFEGELDDDVDTYLGAANTTLILRRGSVLEGNRWRVGLLISDVPQGITNFQLLNDSNWQKIDSLQISESQFRIDLSNLGLPNVNQWLLESRISVRTDGESKNWIHPPRQLYLFVKNASTGAWDESQKAPLAREMKVIVRDESLDLVKKLLQEVAREGWKVSEATVGIPSGWQLIDDVQILKRPLTDPARIELKTLVPDFESQLALNGGFHLLGRAKAWHKNYPPELVVVVQDAIAIRVRILKLFDADESPFEKVFLGTSIGVLDLKELSLEAGDYKIEVSLPKQQSEISSDASTWNVVQISRFHLVEWNDDSISEVIHKNLVHTADSIHVVSSYNLNSDCAMLSGFLSSNTIENTFSDFDKDIWMPGHELKKFEVEPMETGTKLVLKSDTPCFENGMHLFKLPTMTTSRAAGSLVDSCTYCGLQKRWPRKLYLNIPTHIRFDGIEKPVKLDVEPLRPSSEKIDWELGIEALSQLGGGSRYSLEKVASQLDGGEYFPHDFGRVLEALGYIECLRDSQGSIIEWAIVETQLLKTSDGFLAAGRRSNLLKKFAIDNPEVAVETKVNNFGPDNVLIFTTNDSLITNFCRESKIPLIENSRESLSKFLVPISRVLENLEVTNLPLDASWDYFGLDTLRWIPTRGINFPGGYRSRQGFKVEYYFVEQANVKSYRGKQIDSSLVRYASSFLKRTSILSYEAASKTLRAPLGAFPPGLYGRLAVSDTLTSPQLTTRHHEFLGVEPETAALLNYMLLN